MNQTAGTITTPQLDVARTLTQSGSGVINAAKVVLGNGDSLTLANQNTAGTVTFEGSSDGFGGHIIFAGDYDTDSSIGATNGLQRIAVNAGVTLTLDQVLRLTGAPGTITVAGTINKSGASLIQGTTTVNDGGTLNVANSFTHTGNVTVGQGTSGTLNAGGATLNVTGTFDMAAGATFKTTINSAAADDAGKVVSTGAATVAAGTTLAVDTGAVGLTAGTTYKVVDGDGSAGVNVPATITDNNAGFNFVGSVVGGDLVLTVEAAAASLVPAGTAGLSRNATAVSSVVTAAFANDAQMTAAFGGLSTPAEFNQALESLIPDPSGAVQSATFSAHISALNTLSGRLASLRTGGGMMTGMAAGDADHDVGIWVQGFGSSIDQDNRGAVAGFDAGTIGTAAGVDSLLSDQLRAGAAFSYSVTDVDTNGSRNNTDIKSYQGALYASYEQGGYFLDGFASYARNSYDARRHVAVGGVARVASADYDADQLAIKATLGREYDFDGSTFITPYAGLHFVQLDVDGYTETGAGTANLAVKDETNKALQSTLGISVRNETRTAKGVRVVPEAHLAWLHEFLDEEQTNTSTFAGGGASFTTRGFDPASDSLNLGASLAIRSGNNMEVKGTYDFEIKDDYQSHSGMLVVRYSF